MLGGKHLTYPDIKGIFVISRFSLLNGRVEVRANGKIAVNPSLCDVKTSFVLSPGRRVLDNCGVGVSLRRSLREPLCVAMNSDSVFISGPDGRSGMSPPLADDGTSGGEIAKVGLKDLSRLLVLVHCGTYTEAAERLAITETHLRRVARKAGKALGFNIVRPLPGSRLGFTPEAKNWLSGFQDVYQQLSQMNHTLAGLRRLSAAIHLGVETCLAFSRFLTERLTELANKQEKQDLVLRTVVTDAPLPKETSYYLLTGDSCPDPDNFVREYLHHERLCFYSRKKSFTNSRLVELILLPHHRNPPFIDVLSGMGELQGRSVRYTYAASPVDALRLAAQGNGIFPSPALREDIVPSGVSSFGAASEITVPVLFARRKRSSYRPLLGEHFGGG